MTVVETILGAAFGGRSPVTVGYGRVLVAGLAALCRGHRLGLAQLWRWLVERLHGSTMRRSGLEVKG